MNYDHQIVFIDDDENFMRRTLKNSIEMEFGESNIHFYTCRNTNNAIALLEGHIEKHGRLTHLFLDKNLPETDGGVRVAMKAKEISPDVEIFSISSDDSVAPYEKEGINVTYIGYSPRDIKQSLKSIIGGGEDI